MDSTEISGSPALISCPYAQKILTTVPGMGLLTNSDFPRSEPWP